jgi:putative oxidoreductase
MIDSRTAAYGAAALRVGLGALALAHGLTKLLVFTPSGTVGFFASLGLPAIAAWYAITVETLGGAALIVGLYARVAAVLQIPILLGATLVHLPNGWMFANPNGGWEFPLFWAVALGASALLGPGAFAVRDVALPGTLEPDGRFA